jgi:phosphoglycolate phosphatase-like HAD superfamily hydrolase
MNGPELMEKNIFIFDWDGTLYDSMKIKKENFVEAIIENLDINFLNKLEIKTKILRMYEQFSGLPREQIYLKILGNFNISEYSNKFDNFNEIFTKKNKEKLVNSNIFSDAITILKRLIDKKKYIFISSSVPQEELTFFVRKKLKKDTLDNISGVLGSDGNFSKGEAHIEYISNKLKIDRTQMLFISDDISDYEIYSSKDVDSVLINRENKEYENKNIFQVKNLVVLEEIINGKVSVLD